MNNLAYVTIQYPDHFYNATVNSGAQLEEYLSSNLTPFKIVKVELIDPNRGEEMAESLNRISRFGHSLNRTVTAKREEYPTNNERYEIRESGEYLTELAVYTKNTNLLEAVFAGCDRYSLALKYCTEN